MPQLKDVCVFSDCFAMCMLLCTWLRRCLRPAVKAYLDPQTILVFYGIFVASTRTGPWTWTGPSADEKRRGLQRAWRWRASVRRGRTSPFNLPRAAAGRYPSLLCLHNPTSKRWRQSRFLAISLFKGMLGRKRNKKNPKKLIGWSAGSDSKLYHSFQARGKHFATVCW